MHPFCGVSNGRMTKLLILFAIALFLANQSEKYTRALEAEGRSYSVGKDVAFILLVVTLSLFTGFRASYNDTWNYKTAFSEMPGLMEFLEDPDNWNIFKNPLFYGYMSLLRSTWNDPQALIFTTSVFTQLCFLLFFKRYSQHFTFTVLLYFTLGTFCLTMGAIKQVCAMAVITLAIPCLEKRQWIRYFAAVLVAMLIHTYAVVFLVMPVFTQRPWKQFTYLVVLLLVLVMNNFRNVISEFMDQANELGKTLEEYEVFDNHTVNLLRLAVYAVPPLLSFIFMRWIFHDSDRLDHLLVHMSIISLACMSLGTQSGANMFGRMANYFELGTLVSLPWMLNKTFSKASGRVVMVLAAVCFFGFFVYQNRIAGSFDQMYSWIAWVKLFS